MAWGGYLIYKKNLAEGDERAERVQNIEKRYLATHTENMVKLQNFNKKVFAIGVYDDILDDPEFAKMKETKEWKMKIVENSQMIRSVIKEL